MNNEETIIDPQYSNAETQKSETTSVEQPKTAEKKNIGLGEKAAYAVGGAVVGAGSLVTKDIPAWTLAVGRPARVMRVFDGVDIR